MGTGTRFVRILVRALLLIAALSSLLLAVRAYDSRTGPPLELWHTYVPEELSAGQTDGSDWNAYLRHEDSLFEQVRREVTDRLPASAQVMSNRYFKNSPIYPPGFDHDWNRSYEMLPSGKPLGAVVLLHGLTDSPYSLRHIARIYVAHGFVAIGIRLPGHGTVPAGLTDVDWERWMAATRLAMREARRRVGPNCPLEMVGFSNGGALAMKYALDSLEDSRLGRPERIVLFSPMIGITRYARFAGLASLPALLPPFAKAAWLGIVPEFNPFKYNSFPVNGARQSHRLTMALQEELVRLARTGQLAKLPPVLTFQSVIDSTVSTRAILTAMYANFPSNGSELVLFDVNRRAKMGQILNPASPLALSRLVPRFPVAYRLTVIANAPSGSENMKERVVEPGSTQWQTRELDLVYPPQVFSLSHVAIPFPPDDPLYGTRQDEESGTKYGAALGTLVPRGERGGLIVSLDTLFRIASNPFFPYVLTRLDATIGEPVRRSGTSRQSFDRSMSTPAATTSADLPGIQMDGMSDDAVTEEDLSAATP
ncbi:carboxylesterase [Paraburkholderia sp. BL25I1N1]|uniref:alpha/beta hydrolase n=1 Tax=Paraburkholderia sp. BL25I1N1 TaxID=1938804 RepID=UPI000D07765E|nr:alpha/beta hydrolase [Paraburkholderia sp. BL25I1N1]